MRALVQRVRHAAVDVDDETVAEIGPGLLVFVGVGRADTADHARKLAEKVVGLRVFSDGERSMNRSVADVGGEILLVSQFTLYADTRRGRRPSFEPAAPPDEAQALYRSFAEALTELGFPPKEGIFGANMQVRLQNDGPVTLWLEYPSGV
ncbi:MAG TPA: D-aminoacyl-tRNA deacylase [Planctomycetota bacterium]|nr:D-aminoacyl-tRNA deacylase [Planctomycetota bacterium]